MKVALLTCQEKPNGTKDDQILAQRLTDLNYFVSFAVWSDDQLSWRKYDLVIIRSTWDYHRKLDSFLSICRKISEQTTLVNSIETVLWNSSKEYLLEIWKRGISTVPTFLVKNRDEGLIILQEQLRAHICCVVKPTISASAELTFRIETRDQLLSCIDRIFLRGPLILQPFVESIIDDGEVSLIFFAAGRRFKFSHAIQKLPQKYDFRVQTDFGGTVVPFEPSRALIDFALGAISVVPGRIPRSLEKRCL